MAGLLIKETQYINISVRRLGSSAHFSILSTEGSRDSDSGLKSK